MPDTLVRIRAFRYIDVPETPLYRTIMRCFVESRERFTLHLRRADVAAIISGADNGRGADDPGNATLGVVH